MSWIDKELKRRAAARAAPPTASGALAVDDGARVRELWARILAAHAALPEALRLRVDAQGPPGGLPPASRFDQWLHAPNGAALGLVGDGLRYVWPEAGLRRSNNLWIRWQVERQQYIVLQRVGAGAVPPVKASRFDEERIELLLRRLVVGERVRPGDLRRRRWGLF